MIPHMCMCTHPVGRHSHLTPHPCKVDGCVCPRWEFAA